ncbi:MAG: diaminopimelate epimerase [Actinobacteria bacterium]|nr:MAG: diaminopimelate epimerase [Actinomycetota bacterium]TML88820.1 MAG: diaminopimelate epimerase [Actinomycetota bacterium]
MRPTNGSGCDASLALLASTPIVPWARSHMKLSKWQALGNDYLLVEQADLTQPLTPDAVSELCDYHYGVGSDGLLEVVSTDGAQAEIRIWNPDGSIAELSGNGVRIVAAWLARRSGAERVAVTIGARKVEAVVGKDGDIALDVGPVEVGEMETLDLGDERIEFTPVSVGNPHAVVRREPERGEVLRLGPRIERHSRFPDRTNVQLVRVDSPHDLTVGVWERGAGETLSSGTSSLAAAAAAVANGWCESPVAVHLPGGDLLVELDADGNARLTGPAEEICRVELP